jgi:hypothetical protein
VTTAALAVGVTAGPTAAPRVIGGRSRLASDALAARPTASGYAAPLLGGRTSLGRTSRPAGTSAATGRAYPVPSTSIARADNRQEARRRSAGKTPSATAKRHSTATSGAASPPSQSPAVEQPIEIYDSATPAAIPAGVMCATYATGHFAVPAAEMAGRPTIWIDAWGTDPAASVLDVEPGDATPSMVPAWVTAHLALDPSDNARIYTMLDEWPEVQQAVSTLPARVRARIRWWIADPTGVPHMVAGASATQWYWGPSYDISTADPGF